MSENQPCADHGLVEKDLETQEYTIIKMQLIDGERVPGKIKEIMSLNKKIFLVAANSRPETMYGQINCYIYRYNFCKKNE